MATTAEYLESTAWDLRSSGPDRQHVLQIFKILVSSSSEEQCLELATQGLNVKAVMHSIVRQINKKRLEVLITNHEFLESVKLPGSFSGLVLADKIEAFSPLQKSMLDSIQQKRLDTKMEIVDVYWKQVRVYQSQDLIRKFGLMRFEADAPNEDVLRQEKMQKFMGTLGRQLESDKAAATMETEKLLARQRAQFRKKYRDLIRAHFAAAAAAADDAAPDKVDHEAHAKVKKPTEHKGPAAAKVKKMKRTKPVEQEEEAYEDNDAYDDDAAAPAEADVKKKKSKKHVQAAQAEHAQTEHAQTEHDLAKKPKGEWKNEKHFVFADEDEEDEPVADKKRFVWTRDDDDEALPAVTRAAEKKTRRKGAA